ncbi:hypothetical protein EDD86DRAFT_203795, partial [Gorgonomyces haynaldii]
MQTVEDFAVKELVVLTGYEEEIVRQMAAQALSMQQQETNQYFLDLFGTSQEILDFIERFNQKRFPMQQMGAWSERLVKEEPKIQVEQKPIKKKKKKRMERVGNAPLGFEGREVCECMATEHQLITNCLECGKIICEYEGTESCPSCGTSIAGTVTLSGDYDTALARKERLLDYDQNATQRTHVHDVATDFDTSQLYNRWKSKEEKLELQQQLEAQEQREREAKSRRVMTLNLDSQTITFEKESVPKLSESSGVYRRNLGQKAPQFIAQSHVS